MADEFSFTFPAPHNHLWGPNAFDSQVGTNLKIQGVSCTVQDVKVSDDGRYATFTVVDPDEDLTIDFHRWYPNPTTKET